MSNRRVFTMELKREAVRLVIERGLPIQRAAQQLDSHVNVLGKWVHAYKADPAQASPGHGNLKPEQAEIERLRRENARLKMERDILKKATAFFAKESG
ncbi:MAG: transposase [Gammaproteobacteria bacterium]